MLRLVALCLIAAMLLRMTPDIAFDRFRIGAESFRYIPDMPRLSPAPRRPVSLLISDLQAQHGLLRIDDVCMLTGLRSRESVYQLVRKGLLPQPIKLGVRASAWRARDVITFIESRETDPLAQPIGPPRHIRRRSRSEGVSLPHTP